MSNSSISYSITDGEIYFNTVFLSAVIIVTLVGNAIALHAFFVTPTLKRPTYYFIACLCISDIVVATVSMPLWIVDVLFQWDGSNQHLIVMREIYVKIDLFCGTWSIMCLALISIERYICISYALHYFRIMTTRRVYICFAFLLIYASSTLGLVKILEQFVSRILSEYFIVAAAFVIPALIKLFSYYQIFIEARKHAQQINELKIYTQQNKDIHIDDDTSTISGMSLRKHNHSESTTSWTSSPLTRKRQCTQERILVLSDDDEDETIRSKSSSGVSKSLLSNIKGNQNSKRTTKCCYKLLRKKEKEIRKESNIVIKISKQESFNGSFRQPCTDKKHVLVRQNTNGSIHSIGGRPISVLFDRLEEIAEELNSPDQEKVELTSTTNNNNLNYTDDKTYAGRKKTSNSVDWSNNSKKVNEIEDDEDETRKRSFSCPVQTEKRTRKSLEPNDALQIEFDNDSSPSQSRMSKIIRRFSKWSPGNSPVLFRKSFRKSTNSSNSTTAHNRHLQKIRRFKRELRAAKIVALIMGTFLLCWTPFMALIILNAAGVTFPHPMRIVMISKDLHYVNSAINPILYVVLNRVYREAIVRVFQKLKKRLHR